jgi:amino acid adenylation domain-containing protein
VSPRFPAEEIEQSIADRFEKQVAAYPDRLAMRIGDRGLTYAELNAAANRIARAILQTAPQSERVVLLFDQGIAVVVAVLAVLKAGKTYVPLDPLYPAARLADLLTDAEAGLILTSGRYRSAAERAAGHAALPIIDTDDLDPAAPGDDLGLRISPDAIAYMLYTSGSTGRPKGVIQKHRNLLHFVRTYTNSMRIGPEDRIGWLHSMTFSASNMNVYPGLLNGAAVFPYDVKTRGLDELPALLQDEHITVCQCVPTVFRHFLNGLTGQERFPALRVFELGGEPVYRSDVELFRRRVGTHPVLVNRLALTEASVAAQYFITAETALNGSAVPVGRPAEGMEILVLGEDGREVGPDEVGEIALRSRHLSPGYWRRPDLTAKAFPPSENGNGVRMYRTGDLGRMRADGLLEYAGRKDFRVKVRGYTIEVAEVESALLEARGVKSVVVMTREDERGDQRLVAYVVRAGEPPKPAELREHLAARLPDFMIPSAFVVLDAFPVTNTGKLDRLALPAPDFTAEASGNGYVAPRSEVERTVAAIWAEVFGLDRVGIHDDFFALGGHSLLAGRISARIRRAYDVELSLGVLFDAPTVAELGDRVNLALGRSPDA